MDDLFDAGEDPRRNVLRNNSTQNLWRNVTTAEFTMGFTLQFVRVAGTESETANITWDVTYNIAAVVRDHAAPESTFSIKGSRVRHSLQGYDGGTPVSAVIQLAGETTGSAVPRAGNSYNQGDGNPDHIDEITTTPFSGPGYVMLVRKLDGPELDNSDISLAGFNTDGVRQDRVFQLDVGIGITLPPLTYYGFEGTEVFPFSMKGPSFPYNQLISPLTFVGRVGQSPFASQDTAGGVFEFGDPTTLAEVASAQNKNGSDIISTDTYTLTNFTAHSHSPEMDDFCP